MILWCLFYILPLCSVQMLKIDSYKSPSSLQAAQNDLQPAAEIASAQSNLDPAVGFDSQLRSRQT